MEPDPANDMPVSTPNSPEVCDGEDIGLPVAKIGGVDRSSLCNLQEECPNLFRCRDWGKLNEREYFYSDGLLMHQSDVVSKADEILNYAVIVFPKQLVNDIIIAGHNHSGYFGRRRHTLLFLRVLPGQGLHTIYNSL